ncbi:MAG: hypothetical protein GOMPHAMPRED_006670 [Gomphillus americanus]|uniref:F-box domain-containing protein n=1 Tax=Gomphillus americanus TaxID=1940652 RepID=A0A8H3ITG1_9LECA|nr:MAG: hypothetical protein GOMPHAMPRED_006670 [Gomphillus americanus]
MASPTGSSQPSTAEQYTIVDIGGQRNKKHIPTSAAFDKGPLIDTTASLVLNSKKTKRLEKQQLRKKQHRQGSKQTATNLLDLPAELLYEILVWFRPSDVLVLLRTSRSVRGFIRQYEDSIVRGIIRRRYQVLSRCFPLPVSVSRLGDDVQSILLNKKRQDALHFHKVPYQHIRPQDVLKVCSCTWCIVCWNNLCMVLDFSHFQKYLSKQQPIPMIPRGEFPLWNIRLTEHNASIVGKAIHRPMLYAAILQKHLQSIVDTLTRKHVIRREIKSASGKWITTKDTFLRPVYKTRPYQVTDAEVELGSDFFLERAGKPSYEFPFHRDNYYNIEAYVPNRKWSKEEERWLYYDGTQHERDVALAVKMFGDRSANNESGVRMAKAAVIAREENGLPSNSNTNNVEK